MNPGIDYYRPFGQQAYGTLTFIKQLAAGDAITVAGVAYTAGTTFAIGQTLNETAANFAAAVNSDRARYSAYHSQTTPMRSVFAIFYGAIVAIVATAPGTAGNSITIVGVSAKVTASAATLANGANGSALAMAAAAPAYGDCTGIIWYDILRTMTGSAINLAASTTLARQAIVHAPLTNSGTVSFGPNINCRLSLLPGGAYTLPMIPGAVFDLLNFYCNGTVSDTLVILYAR